MCLLILTACQQNAHTGHTAARDTVAQWSTPAVSNDTPDSTADADSADSETATYYVVVADTGLNYASLHNEMLQMNKTTGLEIDTMGRGYNEQKNLICLPENDEDEIYAGEYFPRRFPSVNLSLEYLEQYMPEGKAGEKTIALVAGIFDTQQSADSLLKVIRPQSPQPFATAAKIFIGCMH